MMQQSVNIKFSVLCTCSLMLLRNKLYSQMNYIVIQYSRTILYNNQFSFQNNAVEVNHVQEYARNVMH
jgi:hypothetical protein